MNEAVIVGLKIIAMFLVMGVGFLAYRRNVLNSQTTLALSRFVTDFTLPALILVMMVETIDLSALRVGWTVPLLASAGICVGFVFGWATWRLFATRSQAPVFIFASGISNWVYLPLPIVTALYKTEGLQTLFLSNLGLQVLFWTLGVAILHGGRIDRKALNHLLTNPGLIATVLGIAIALIYGANPALLSSYLTAQPAKSVLTIIIDGLRLLGQATIPVSLIVTGAQIASATLVQKRPTSALAGIMLNRLALAPLVAILGLWLFSHLCPALSHEQLLVIALIIIMPVSVTSTVLTDKMNQDTALAASSVLYTTLASILTVPLMFILAKMLLGR